MPDMVSRTPSGKVIFPPLTLRQQEVLRFLIDTVEARRSWPTQREVGERFTISQSAVYNLLGTLVRKGYIVRQGRGAGYLVLTEVGTEWYQLDLERQADRQLALPMADANEETTTKS